MKRQIFGGRRPSEVSRSVGFLPRRPPPLLLGLLLLVDRLRQLVGEQGRDGKGRTQALEDIVEERPRIFGRPDEETVVHRLPGARVSEELVDMFSDDIARNCALLGHLGQP